MTRTNTPTTPLLRTWPPREKASASRKAPLEFHASSYTGLLLWRQASALNMSNMTKAVKVMVRSREDTSPS